MSMLTYPSPTDEEARDAAEATAELIAVLNSPIRRAILRYLLKQGPSRSKDIHRGIPIPVGNNIRHHLKTLVDCEAISCERGRGRGQGRGSESSTYAITKKVTETEWAIGVLRTTAAGDS